MIFIVPVTVGVHLHGILIEKNSLHKTQTNFVKIHNYFFRNVEKSDSFWNVRVLKNIRKMKWMQVKPAAVLVSQRWYWGVCCAGVLSSLFGSRIVAEYLAGIFAVSCKWLLARGWSRTLSTFFTKFCRGITISNILCGLILCQVSSL